MTPKTIPERKDIPDDYKWDLTSLFNSDEDWDKLFGEVESRINAYSDYKGRLKESVKVFKEALDVHLSLTHKIERIYTYAHLKSDEDKSNQFYEGLHQRAVSLYTRASESSSFMTPEIQSIADDQMNYFLTDDSIAEYKFYLEKIFTI